MSGKAVTNSPKKTLSRIGRRPVAIPKDVTVELDYCKIIVNGPK